MKHGFKKARHESRVKSQKSGMRSEESEVRNQKRFTIYSVFCILSSVFFILIAGCAAPPPKKEAAVFFPSPPELPRVQYLTAYSGTRDIMEENAFQAFVVGKQKNIILDKPYGVAIFEGKIYVADSNRTVMVFDLEKKTFEPLKGARGLGKLVQPINISIEKDGTKYVTDPVREQVVVFDRSDEFVKTYGLAKGGWKPIDALAYEDRVYVTDIKNSAIRVFDKKTGDVIKSFGDKGDPNERLHLPTNLAMDGEGRIYVTDAGKFQVFVFDRDGHFLSAIGKEGDNIGHFARPKGIALDREGYLYAVDAAFNNVQIFTREGRIVLFFGGPGQRRGDLFLPAKVIVDYDNMKYFEKYIDPNFEAEHLVIVTSQFGNRMVNVFALGKQKGKKYPTDEELLKTIQETRQKELDKLKSLKGEEEKKEPDEAVEKGKEGGKPSEGEKGKEQAAPQESEKGKEETVKPQEDEKGK